MKTCGLCMAIESASSCQGNDGWASTILSVGKSTGDVVDVDRVGVLEPDPTAPGKAGADARVTGVEQRRQPCLLDHLVERIGKAVVREEPLHVGVELEATDAVVGDQAPRLVDPASALVRVDARERDQHVRVGSCDSAISSFGTRACPVTDSESTVKTTAIIRRSR